jgi:hypothetical protein
MSPGSLPTVSPLTSSLYNVMMNQNNNQTPQSNEEISTIFVVGFPDDMQEREFQNMFIFSPGFEAATLKVPSKDQEDEMGLNTPTTNIISSVTTPTTPSTAANNNARKQIVSMGLENCGPKWLFFFFFGFSHDNTFKKKRGLVRAVEGLCKSFSNQPSSLYFSLDWICEISYSNRSIGSKGYFEWTQSRCRERIRFKSRNG